MVLKSYAKLNLYLKVLKLRKDKYHSLKSLFERIDLADRIIIRSTPDKRIRIICKDAAVPQDSANLCYKSAKLLQDVFGITKGADITIEKNIPVGAGLGGGSSNAATVLLGLNKIWKLNISREKLAKLGAKVGSDVPFFIYASPFALVTGRGERIKPLKLLNKGTLWHIIIVPKLHVSTPLIYKKWDDFSGISPTPTFNKTGSRKLVWGLTKPKYDVKLLLSVIEKKGLIWPDGVLFNSLEAVTVKLYPEVRLIKEKLSALGVKSILMSGSGPAVFGIVSSRKEAVALRERLTYSCSRWRVFAAKTF
ncbi:MAG: 4-(cytidine 5'-diphospho)-2-C-methyl-D-erythritol kinase [Candidatus Omnitrophica bacterium]|nr:4-(cytidine 5'-diphospho)-2-C-methyl-D-erythritol kinase [Candidatus Omnitrophota bacterium]MBU1870205.1 4-(cytidine 5'-diphospho)-2-C-methyl-D-erythritol kinase [Candidatus Omnitrophota bacterium]